MAYIQSCHDFKLINKYDDNGNLTLHMGSDGNIKKYKYDKNNNLIYFNDIKNKIEKIKTYDEKNRLLKTTSSNGSISEHEYIEDVNGNLIEERIKSSNIKDTTNHIIIKRYEYFEDGSYKVTITGDNIATTIEIYNDKDQLILYSSNKFSCIINYDDYGRKIREMNTIGVEELWKYNDNGDLLTHSVNRQGKNTFRIDYKYDEYGRLIAEKNMNGIVVNYYYEDNNSIVHVKTSNGYYENINYDKEGRKVKVENNTEIKRYKYDYDNHLIMFIKSRKPGKSNESKVTEETTS